MQGTSRNSSLPSLSPRLKQSHEILLRRLPVCVYLAEHEGATAQEYSACTIFRSAGYLPA